MGIFQQFPYSNFHEDNLDQIIKIMREMQDEWENTKTEWASYKDFIDNYFANLNLDAETEKALRILVADGTLDPVIDPVIIAETQAWLADHITQPTNPAIDTSLTVAGAAADAKATGDAISDVHYDIQPDNDCYLDFYNVVPDNLFVARDAILGKYIDANGVEQTSATWACTDYIDVHDYANIRGLNVGLSSWYDSSKVFISSFTLGSNIIPVPSGAYYLRCSILQSNLSTAIISYHDFYSGYTRDYPVAYWQNPKKGYEPGYIQFTVPVNNTVATYSDDTETNHEGTPNYVNVDCVLSLPLRYKPIGNPCKLIMMCHGAGKGVSGAGSWLNDSGYNTLVSMFNSYGYAVFDCNGFKNDALGWSFWGNQRGVEAWRKAYKYVTDYYNVEKTFSIYAFSMGGLTAMNLAFQGFPNIDSIALGSPVLDLHKAWESTDGTKAVINTLYDMTTWDEAKVVGDNPYKHIIEINGIDYCPYQLPPIKIWYGSTETNNASNPSIDKDIAKDFVDAITNSGGYAYYREVAGRGHEICYGMSSVVNQEILYFIERYERFMPEYY